MSTPVGQAITRLGDNNYKGWQADMKDILCRERLWRVTESDKGKPEVTAKPAEWEKWEEKREMVSATIRLWMEEDVHWRYTDDKYCIDPIALWKKLAKDRKKMIALDKDYLWKQLFEVTLEESGSVNKYLEAIEAIIDQLKTCDVTITNGEHWFMIINGLPSSWEVFTEITRGVITDESVLKFVAHMNVHESCLK
jgi:hypothetical protein